MSFIALMKAEIVLPNVSMTYHVAMFMSTSGLVFDEILGKIYFQTNRRDKEMSRLSFNKYLVIKYTIIILWIFLL